MITKWRLFNFKSVRQQTELTFKPLTIFAGANSSGKSTVVQSILLVSQTVASKIPSRSVVLNGHLVKLGQFEDLRHQQSESQQIAIGWEAKPLDEPMPQPTGRPPSLRQRPFADPVEHLRSVSMTFSFDALGDGAERELYQLQPSFFGMSLNSTIRAEDGSDFQSRLSVSKISDIEFAKSQELLKPDLNEAAKEEILRAIRFEASLDETGEQFLREHELSFDTRGCILKHFLPKGFVASFEQEKNFAETVVRALSGDPLPRRFQDIPIPEEVVELVKSHFKEEPHPGLTLLSPAGSPKDGTATQVSVRECSQRMRFPRVRPERRDQVRKIIKGLEVEIHSIICRSEQPTIGWRRVALPEPVRAAVDYTEEWFSECVKYLGPLRDEPKPLYPLVANANPFDIGLKGEHTAAVLHLHRDRPVTYLPSENFRSPRFGVQRARRSLKFAVLDWLRYLGVAEDVDTRDQGKLGHELKVRLSVADQPHDLTHVGVGVSQVLPIVVSCLLANPDTTLIFEQPELHLHPRVQTLLADFFLSMAQLDKQCILETHSEYLINRLRFRAAAADKESVSSIAQLFFVEKREGASAFREVKINQYGVILDWPDGFFDQSQREAEEILRAGFDKKNRERKQD